MTEPSRLLEGGTTAFERQLLDAAASERPPAELVASMQQALGASACAVKAGAGAAGTSSIAYAALAALAAGGAVVALVLLREAPHAPREAPSESRSGVMKAPLTRAPVAPAPIATLPGVESQSEPARAVSNEPARSARRAVRASSAGELRDEIRLMDQARAALRAGATERALSLLARYAERYPGGAFRQEATVLQLEALERAGQRGKASSLARKFLEEHPESPHVERVGRTAAGD